MHQPHVRDDLILKLNRIAAAYEITPEAMLNHIVAVALDEQDGGEDDCTLCIPVAPHARDRPSGDETSAAMCKR